LVALGRHLARHPHGIDQSGLAPNCSNVPESGTAHQFIVFANKTTLAVAGVCRHVSAYGLVCGCAHALLSMWVHAYFFSVMYFFSAMYIIEN